MADIALAALYRAIRQRATAGGELWGQNAKADFATSGTPMPYLVYWWLAGGEENLVRAQDAFFRIGMKVVADNQTQAFAGAARISALFNDMGTQDVVSGYLNGGADWYITTSTLGLAIHIVEQVSGATPLYHEGFQVAFRMHET